jgi:DNA-directed RNA polymerase specialized sigma subunit
MPAKNPVEDFLQAKEAAPNARREKEHALWETWNANDRTPKHLEPLLNVFEPVVKAKIREWKAPRVNESAFRAELHTHMIKAFQDFDASRGASLRTHVENRIKKAKRYNAKHQNFAYIPEDPARFIGKIQRAQDELKEDLGRDPTHLEIARSVNDTDPKAKLTTKRVGEIITYQRADRLDSGWTYDPVSRDANREQEVLSLIQAELPSVFPNEDDRSVFEHIYGINGKALITGTNELAKKLGKSPSQISRIKSSVGNRVKGLL